MLFIFSPVNFTFPHTVFSFVFSLLGISISPFIPALLLLVPLDIFWHLTLLGTFTRGEMFLVPVDLTPQQKDRLALTA